MSSSCSTSRRAGQPGAGPGTWQGRRPRSGPTRVAAGVTRSGCRGRPPSGRLQCGGPPSPGRFFLCPLLPCPSSRRLQAWAAAPTWRSSSCCYCTRARHRAPARTFTRLTCQPVPPPCPHQVVECDNLEHTRDDWDTCPFAHVGEVVTRRPPHTHLPKLCPKARRACRKGRACPYAHNVFEHWLHPSRFKTEICQHGSRCGRGQVGEGLPGAAAWARWL
jgi:hypothetical protein